MGVRCYSIRADSSGQGELAQAFALKEMAAGEPLYRRISIHEMQPLLVLEIRDGALLRILA